MIDDSSTKTITGNELEVISKCLNTRKQDIPILDTIEVNDFIFGRFDILLNKYYGAYENRMALYPFLLDFNGISDPTSINKGMMIDIPDLDYLLEQIEVYNESMIAGVNLTTNSKAINETQSIEEADSTLAVPKLGIKGKKAKYDPVTGVIKF